MKNHIREQREKKKISQRQLGGMVGTSQQQVQRWESGKEVSLQTMKKISEAMDVSPMTLFPEFRESFNWARSFGNNRKQVTEEIKKQDDSYLKSLFSYEFFLKGSKKPFKYVVSGWDAEWIHESTYGESYFAYFEEVETHRSIFINSSLISKYARIWIPPEDENSTLKKLKRAKLSTNLIIHMNDSDKPLEVYEDEDNDQPFYYFGAETGGDNDYMMFWNLNELIHIKTKEIVLMEVPYKWSGYEACWK